MLRLRRRIEPVLAAVVEDVVEAAAGRLLSLDRELGDALRG